MLFYTFLSAFLLLEHALANPVPRYAPQGTIATPANETNILPGTAFAFAYTPRSDYCLAGRNFTVWLLTSTSDAPSVSALLAGDVTGYYFGRYAYSTFANMNPPNPAPSTLVMPDFSQSGEFEAGKNASAQSMYLAVLEEWTDCDPTLGSHFSVAANTIVYNGTEGGS